MRTNTASHPSLDELLKEIQHESSNFPDITSAGGTSTRQTHSAGMQNISAHISESLSPAPRGVVDTPGIWEKDLSPRQRALPKLDLRMVAGFVMVVVMAFGIGTTTYLTQQSQDLRQSAYEQTLPALEETPATETTELLSGMDAAELAEKQWALSQQMTLLGAIILGVTLFFLIGFLAWLFFA